MCSSHLSPSAIGLNANTCGGAADWPSRRPGLVARSHNERDFQRGLEPGIPKQPLMDSCVRAVNLGPGPMCQPATAGQAGRDAPVRHFAAHI